MSKPTAKPLTADAIEAAHRIWPWLQGRAIRGVKIQSKHLKFGSRLTLTIHVFPK